MARLSLSGQPFVFFYIFASRLPLFMIVHYFCYLNFHCFIDAELFINDMTIRDSIASIHQEIGHSVTLVAVSKTHPTELIQEAYDAGQRHFGENKVQELVDKAAVLPTDIHWHMIGHLQSNKIKYIASFVDLIHGVDSLKLLQAINKEGEKISRVIPCLLQLHIASEDTKFGFSKHDLLTIMESGIIDTLAYVRICGLMGMATFTYDQEQIRSEFKMLHSVFHQIKERCFAGDAQFDTLSMGMSDDDPLAIQEGSNMIRVGSKIFGHRFYDSLLNI